MEIVGSELYCGITGIPTELLEFRWDYRTLRNFNYFPLGGLNSMQGENDVIFVSPFELYFMYHFPPALNLKPHCFRKCLERKIKILL